jgi:hypothetical protein
LNALSFGVKEILLNKARLDLPSLKPPSLELEGERDQPGRPRLWE